MSKLIIRTAIRTASRLRLAFQGNSGSGKTYSALKVAYGITGDWGKVAVIDTENESADLYAHLGDYLVVPFPPPHNPDRFIEAMRLAENAGAEVIIIDSISHEWAGVGGMLEIVDTLADQNSSKNKFNAWNPASKKHNSFIAAMLSSPCHVIATMRMKAAYSQDKDERTGRTKIEKIGERAVQRDLIEYEFTSVFTINKNHLATSDKDRTGVFDGREFALDEEAGKQLVEWLGASKYKLDEKRQSTLLDLFSVINAKPEHITGALREYSVRTIEQLKPESADALIERLAVAYKKMNSPETPKPVAATKSPQPTPAKAPAATSTPPAKKPLPPPIKKAPPAAEPSIPMPPEFENEPF